MKQRLVAALFCAALGVSSCALYHDTANGSAASPSHAGRTAAR